MGGVKNLLHRTERERKQDEGSLPAEVESKMTGEELLMEPVGARRKPIISVHGRDVEEDEIEKKRAA